MGSKLRETPNEGLEKGNERATRSRSGTHLGYKQLTKEESGERFWSYGLTSRQERKD